MVKVQWWPVSYWSWCGMTVVSNNRPWWKSSLRLLFVVITHGKVSLWLWNSLEISGKFFSPTFWPPHMTHTLIPSTPTLHVYVGRPVRLFSSCVSCFCVFMYVYWLCGCVLWVTLYSVSCKCFRAVVSALWAFLSSQHSSAIYCFCCIMFVLMNEIFISHWPIDCIVLIYPAV